MNWIQSIRDDRWTYRLYLLVACSPLIILIGGFMKQYEAYQQIRRGIKTLQSSVTFPDPFSPAIDPAMQRLELVSTAHLVMMVLEGVCLLFVLGWVLKVMLQRTTFDTPRTTLLQVWAISVLPTITIYLVTEAVINQANDGSSGWLAGAIVAVLFASIWLYAKLKGQDELEQGEVVSRRLEKKRNL